MSIHTAHSLLGHHGLISLWPWFYLVYMSVSVITVYSHTMGRLADYATLLDIIAQLHASLLLCSFLRMAAGELNKRAACF